MKKANVMRGVAAAMLFASLSPIACGSDSGKKDTTTPDTSSTAKEDAGPPPSTIPAGSVGCGSKVCSVPAGETGTACCADAFSSICGLTSALGGACTKAPAPEPSDCPKLSTMGGFIQLRSCCTTAGQCGIDESAFKAGCISYADATSMAAMYTKGFDAGALGGMFNVTLPPEQSCDATADNASN
ncbi:MAG TPA: hypothetical protein VH062_26675 [Polyangiaceae bacterium]|jgi:hypothetical protein|nr:hypothetical protein [Polyangiaceae bacterium]